MRRLLQVVGLLAVGALLLAPTGGGVARAAPAIDPLFVDYYYQHDGIRLLGYPLAGLTTVQDYPAQYFEKGRLEDHRRDVADPAWRFMLGRLTAELMERDPAGAVSTTSLTYGDLAELAGPQFRLPPPPGFAGGTQRIHDGMFVPYDPALRPAPGHAVAPYFWAYITNAALFPGGWLHDVGLPLTEPQVVEVVKGGAVRTIWLQAFERTVLSYDPQNPAGWQVERANIGADAVAPLARPRIATPAPGASVTLPLHVEARLGQPGQAMVAALRWRGGTTLARTFTLWRGENGRGLLLDSLDWATEGMPPQPPTQPATLELRWPDGTVVARQPVTVLSPADPDVRAVLVYFVAGDTVVPVWRLVPATPRIGAAALDELLWGPGPRNLAGVATAIPTPEQVLAYPGRGADWGARVTLRSLTIENGVATADFSRELRAYGGGSVRVKLIRDQVARTLLQFPSVQTVRITIEGQPDLQP